MQVYKLISLLWSDLSVELPFTLTHPKPEQVSIDTNALLRGESIAVSETSNTPEVTTNGQTNQNNDQQVPVDLNLIQFDTRWVQIQIKEWSRSGKITKNFVYVVV